MLRSTGSTWTVTEVSGVSLGKAVSLWGNTGVMVTLGLAMVT